MLAKADYGVVREIRAFGQTQDTETFLYCRKLQRCLLMNVLVSSRHIFKNYKAEFEKFINVLVFSKHLSR